MAVYSDYTAVATATYEKMVATYTSKIGFWNRIQQKSSKNVSVGDNGSYYVKWAVDPIQYSATRPVAHDGALPSGTSGASVEARLNLYNCWTPLKCSGIQRVQGAIIGNGTVLENELKRGWEDHRSFLERLIWLPADGFLATCTASGASYTVYTNSTRFFKPGMKIDTYTSLSTTPSKDEDSKTISSIDRSLKTLTLSATASTAVGDGICEEDTYGLLPGGILSLANDNAMIGNSSYDDWFVCNPTTTYANISRASYASWSAKVLRHATSGTLRTLTEGMMGLALAESKINDYDTSGGSAIWCDPGMAYTISKLDSKSTVINNWAEKGVGFTSVSYLNYLDQKVIPVIPIQTAPPHTIIFAPEDDLKIAWTGQPDYDRSDGEIWTSQTKMSTATDTCKANILTRLVPYATNPSRWVVLTDLSYHSDMSSTYPY